MYWLSIGETDPDSQKYLGDIIISYPRAQRKPREHQ
jgi:ssRNA-specific RNase YbeY (16S rRNA maturation enzyme)